MDRRSVHTTSRTSVADKSAMRAQRQEKPTKGDPDSAPSEMSSNKLVPVVPLGQDGLSMKDVTAIGYHAPNRDLVLQVRDPTSAVDLYFGVSSAVLRQNSPYFRVLLDPAKFKEGISFDIDLRKLLDKYSSLDLIPPERLPRITITDLGQLPTSSSLRPAVTTFLCILHDTYLRCKFLGLHCLTMVAIIADRFETTDILTNQLNRGHWRNFFSQIHPSQTWGKKQEIQTRQLLLISLLLKTGIRKFKQHSANLVSRGSEQWTGKAIDRKDDDALWWHLPYNMEEELMCRREYLLETISSIQTYFIKLYTFQPNQCKLGYDTSPACNSFQLGEAIRFFVRKGTLTLQNTIYPTELPTAWQGDVEDLIASLRQCPSYQLDNNHMHCGPRNRLIIALDAINPMPNVGVCFQCWLKDAHGESWLESPMGGKWAINLWKPGPVVEPQGCGFHRKAKAMFTAEERDWTAT